MRNTNDDDQQLSDDGDDAADGEFLTDDDDVNDPDEVVETDETDAVNVESPRNESWLSAPAPRARRARAVRRRVPGPRPPASDIEVAPGRIAIAQGQVYIIGGLLVIQLFLITTALLELLSGRYQILWEMAVGSLGIFIVALVVALWPRRARDVF